MDATVHGLTRTEQEGIAGTLVGRDGLPAGSAGETDVAGRGGWRRDYATGICLCLKAKCKTKQTSAATWPGGLAAGLRAGPAGLALHSTSNMACSNGRSGQHKNVVLGGLRRSTQGLIASTPRLALRAAARTRRSSRRRRHGCAINIGGCGETGDEAAAAPLFVRGSTCSCCAKRRYYTNAARIDVRGPCSAAERGSRPSRPAPATACARQPGWHHVQSPCRLRPGTSAHTTALRGRSAGRPGTAPGNGIEQAAPIMTAKRSRRIVYGAQPMMRAHRAVLYSGEGPRWAVVYEQRVRPRLVVVGAAGGHCAERDGRTGRRATETLAAAPSNADVRVCLRGKISRALLWGGQHCERSIGCW